MSTAALSDTQTLALATLGRMVSTVAHEIRNLLGGIELYASLLAEQCERSEELAPVTGRLLSGVRQLGAVASNLLSVSRRSVPDLLPVDAVHVVTDLLDSIRLAVRGTGVRLDVRRRVGKANVLADPERLRQALLNLVLNAIQAMPDGGVLTIDTHVRDARIEITVKDAGTGMDRATLRRAFEPFFTTRPNGTGLGLAVVREVAEAHGASLTISSRVGRGTTVRLALPLAHDPVLAPSPSPLSSKRLLEAAGIAGGSR